MIDSNGVDIGSIHIHKKAIADLTYSAICEIDGVSLIPKDLFIKLLEYLGEKKYSGIVVTIDKNGLVAIEVRIRVRYGINIQDIARQIQDAVRSAVERTVDISLKDISVNVYGIERGN